MDGKTRNLALVAHRGYPLAFPENTLLGYQQSVVAHGAAFVEADVQCTRDGVPVLYHDGSTRRLSGVGGSVVGRSFEELRELSAHHPDRFAGRFAGTPIPHLRMFSTWLAGHPGVTAFIEVKKESLKRFGIEPVMERVMEAIDAVKHQCVIISFNDRCIEHTAARYGIRTGWVLPRWNARVESRARELAPDYLFADCDFIPEKRADIWRGPWQWAAYVINDLAPALSFVERGFHLIETDAVGDLLEQSRAGASGSAVTE